MGWTMSNHLSLYSQYKKKFSKIPNVGVFFVSMIFLTFDRSVPNSMDFNGWWWSPTSWTSSMIKCVSLLLNVLIEFVSFLISFFYSLLTVWWFRAIRDSKFLPLLFLNFLLPLFQSLFSRLQKKKHTTFFTVGVSLFFRLYCCGYR